MKIDVVVSNPPYNKDKYLDFVEFGHSLASKCSVFITPAKWQAKGGKQNEAFRKDIVPHMSKIVYYPDCGDVFSISEVGGVCYFILDKKYKGNKDIRVLIRKQDINREYTAKVTDTNLLHIEALSIIDKLDKSKYDITKYPVNKYNVMLSIPPAIGGQKGGKNGYLLSSEGKLQCLPLPHIVKDTNISNYSDNYKIVFSSDNESECKYLISYLYTKFIRFLIYIGLVGNSTLTMETWRFVQDPGKFDHIFTDEELYKKYNLTEEEIAVIESVIKERKVKNSLQ